MNEPVTSDQPRVAVAEDDPTVRAMLGAWLHTEGCVGELFVDVRSAAEALAVREFDLLISDVQLPDGTGHELVTALAGPNLGLPVIFLTGEPNLEAAMGAVKLRVSAYLVKPPDLVELSRLVRREIAGQRYRRAVGSSRRHLAEWDGELARLEQLPVTLESRPAVAYLQVTVRHLGALLGELDRSVTLLSQDPAGRESLEQIDLIASLRRTVAILNRTREHFKSKDLGDLRKDLEGLLRRVGKPGGK